jgi:hypothetical protein
MGMSEAKDGPELRCGKSAEGKMKCGTNSNNTWTD